MSHDNEASQPCWPESPTQMLDDGGQDEAEVVSDTEVEYDAQEIQKVITMLESMQQLIPQNKYTEVIQSDIDNTKVECLLIVTTPAGDNDPESTGADNLKRRMGNVMRKYAEMKEVYDSIMAAPKKVLKRTPSDPPRADAASSSNTKCMRANDTDGFEDTQVEDSQ